MTARPRKNTESPEEYRRALLQQVFTSGETHAEHKEKTVNVQKKFEVKDHDSLFIISAPIRSSGASNR